MDQRPKKRARRAPTFSKEQRDGLIVTALTRIYQTADADMLARILSLKFRSSQTLKSVIEIALFIHGVQQKRVDAKGTWKITAPGSPKAGWVVTNKHLGQVFDSSAGWVGNCLKAARLLKNENVRRHHAQISAAYHEVLDDNEQEVDEADGGDGEKWGALSLRNELSQVAKDHGVEQDDEDEGMEGDGE